MTGPDDVSLRPHLVGQLREAWAAVAEAGIPEHLHSCAFEHSLRVLERAETQSDLVACGDLVIRGKSVRGDSQEEIGNSVSKLQDDEDAFFGKFSKESGIEEQRLREVYFVVEGTPSVGLTKSRLGVSEAERNRTLALLLLGQRWYVEGLKTISIGEVRGAAHQVPYEVSRNLGKHLDDVAGTFTVGKRSDKSIRVNESRFDHAFAETINRVSVG